MLCFVMRRFFQIHHVMLVSVYAELKITINYTDPKKALPDSLTLEMFPIIGHCVQTIRQHCLFFAQRLLFRKTIIKKLQITSKCEVRLVNSSRIFESKNAFYLLHLF